MSLPGVDTELSTYLAEPGGLSPPESWTSQVVNGPGTGGSFPAGTEGVWTVPAGFMAKLDHFASVCDMVTTGTYYPGYLIADENGNTIRLQRCSQGYGATSQPVIHSNSRNTQIQQDNNSPEVMQLPMPDLWLWPGCTVSSSCLNLAAASQYQSIHWGAILVPLADFPSLYP